MTQDDKGRTIEERVDDLIEELVASFKPATPDVDDRKHTAAARIIFIAASQTFPDTPSRSLGIVVDAAGALKKWFIGRGFDLGNPPPFKES